MEGEIHEIPDILQDCARASPHSRPLGLNDFSGAGQFPGGSGVAPITPTVEKQVEQFKKLAEGESMSIPGSKGQELRVTKTGGVPHVAAPASSSVLLGDGPQASTQGFCHAAAMAAVLTIGAAGFAFMAASGGGVVMGIALGARAAGQIAAALSGGAGLEALVAVYIC